MSNITLDEMTPLLLRETSARRGMLLSIFAFVALVFLLLAATWQKKYESYAQLYVDDSRIVAPLLNGGTTLNAATAQDSNQANIAKQELFSADIMDKILVEVPFIDENTGDVERERIRENIVKNTNIQNINNQLIRIEFQDPDPTVAYNTVRLYSSLFLEKSMKNSSEETTEAFDFIIDQVETYRNKLEDSDKRLESFRNQYPGLSEDTGGLNARVLELDRDIEKTQLNYAQANQKRLSLERELSSTSNNLAREAQADQLRSRISALQGEIDGLRLSYTDDYPDIVRLKQQVADLEEQALNPTQQSGFGGSSLNSPVYQLLRSNLASASAEADALSSKLSQLRVLREKEIGRSAASGRVEREYAELTRDYTINKEIFEDLLRRQESARLAMTLNTEKQGVLYRIAQEAIYPYLPTGLRFVHLALAGMVLSVVLPLGFLIVFLKLDPRIRTSSSITEVLELPLLTTVPHMSLPKEKPGFLRRPAGIWTVVGIVIALYMMVTLLKFVLSSSGQGGGIL